MGITEQLFNLRMKQRWYPWRAMFWKYWGAKYDDFLLALGEPCWKIWKEIKKIYKRKIKLIILFLLFPGVILIWYLCGWYMFFKESFGKEQASGNKDG